jgi:hypothetical protein
VEEIEEHCIGCRFISVDNYDSKDKARIKLINRSCLLESPTTNIWPDVTLMIYTTINSN